MIVFETTFQTLTAALRGLKDHEQLQHVWCEIVDLARSPDDDIGRIEDSNLGKVADALDAIREELQFSDRIMIVGGACFIHVLLPPQYTFTISGIAAKDLGLN